MGSRSVLLQAYEACPQLPTTGSAEVLNQCFASGFFWCSFFVVVVLVWFCYFFCTAAYLCTLFQAASILKLSATAKGKLSNVLKGKRGCF